MRTTLTLDDDVATLLRRVSQERKRAFKQTVNDALRAGLEQLTAKQPGRRKLYRVSTVSLGKPRLLNLDNIAEILAIAEGERHS